MEDRCIMCGAVVPEGRQVCANCEREKKKTRKLNSVVFTDVKEFEKNLADAIKKFYIPAWQKILINDGVLPEEEQSAKDQSIKADAGKPQLRLVPTEIIYEIEKVRSFGSAKYGSADGWRNVEMERYHDALLRHTLAVWDDITARDKESGLLHLSHIATNVAFLLEMMKEKE